MVGRNEENYRAWRATNREKLAARARQYRAANPEASRASVAAYRRRNLEAERKRRREYMASVRLEDPVGWKQKLRTWFKSNRDKARAYEAKQRAARGGAEGSYTAKDVQLILEAQLGLCFYCEVPLSAWHEDHFVPLSKGGTNYRSNIVLACVQCNLRKGDRAPIVFMNWKMRLPQFWHEQET